MWQRSGLTAREFGALVGLSKHTLFIWKKKFERAGPAGLSDAPRGAPPGSRLSEPTQRAILMLKWSYDEAGNRTVDQADDAVFATTHDNMNRLQARAPGGPIVFSGSLNEAGTVTIDGKTAEVDASNNFRGTANLTGATTTVTVKAKDASGNETTNQYEVDASGSTSSYTYDANGNLTSDGTKIYSWNALNQLVEVKEGSTTIATFEYDGGGRRTEKVAAGATHQYIFDAEDIVEERISGSISDVIRYYHGVGIDEPLARKNSSDVVTYYLADHLGSIVQESSTASAITLEREYDPWGVAMQGVSTSGHAFTGREWDSEVELQYSRSRYYLPNAGRFASDTRSVSLAARTSSVMCLTTPQHSPIHSAKTHMCTNRARTFELSFRLLSQALASRMQS
jgi:RHS repeat-associated protein